MYIYLYIAKFMHECVSAPPSFQHAWAQWKMPNIVSQNNYQLKMLHILNHLHNTTAYCIWSVISPISDLNRWSSHGSLGLFLYVPLERYPLNWDQRLRLDDTPNAIRCTVCHQMQYAALCVTKCNTLHCVSPNAIRCTVCHQMQYAVLYIWKCFNIVPHSNSYLKILLQWPSQYYRVAKMHRML